PWAFPVPPATPSLAQQQPSAAGKGWMADAAPRHQAAGSRATEYHRRLSRGGNGKVKIGSLADSAFHPQLSAVRLHNMLGDREAQSGATDLARARHIDAVEPLKDTLLVSLRDANPVVGDGNLDRTLNGPGPHTHPATRRSVLHGVVEQV